MPEHRIPPPSASLLARFRSHKKRLPLHPLERAVLTVLALHLCFLPWALGTMHPWSQITSLSLSLLTFTLALIPRTYSGDYVLPVAGPPAIGSAAAGRQLPVDGRQSPIGSPPSTVHSPPSTSPDAARLDESRRSLGEGGLRPPSSVHRPPPTVYRLNPWPRLLRFPIFWIGLALLAYIAIQGFNPSWVWERNATTWWLRRVNDIPWLPTSIDTPFERFNLWRQFIIYASAWFTVCTMWIGFTRRRSLEILLSILALNGVALVLTGFVCRMFRPPQFLLWFDEPRRGVMTFASFIYKNHAGAWFALAAAIFVFIASARHQSSIQKMERSSPAVLFVLGALLMFFAEIFTFSRGGTALLAAFLLFSGGAYCIHRLVSRRGSTTHSLVPITVTLMVALVVGYGASQLDYRDMEQRFALLFQENTKDESILFRKQAHLASGEMLGEHWQRGVGAGGFRFLYPEYIKKHPDIYQGGRLFWEHAHNDWLQVPIEQGAVGTSLLLLGGGWWLLGLLRLRVWRDLPALLLTLGLGQTLIHATFDFPFQNPAILITWCLLAVLTIRRLELENA